MIVDSHVHLQPARLARAVREFFESHIPGVLAYPADHEITLRALADAGIGEVWNLPYAHKPGVARGLNAASAALSSNPPVPAVGIVGGATVHPGDDRPVDVLTEAFDGHGLQVVKLHCSVGDYQADDPRFDAVWTLLERRSVPTVVHAGHGVEGTTGADELAGLDRVAGRFPGVPIVIAHSAHPATAAALDLVRRHPNVYVDLTPCVTEPVALGDADIEQNRHRILFGTDAPNTAIPVERGITRVRRLSPATQEAVLGGNARRLVRGRSHL